MHNLNPTTGEPVPQPSNHTQLQIEARLDASVATYGSWKTTPLAKRTTVLERTAVALRERSEALARTITTEMGKPIGEARAEVEKCAWLCRYYAEHAQAFLASESPSLGADGAVVRFEPLGLIFAVMPWNFPLWQVFRCAVPALVAGNTVLLKHAPLVPNCALACQQLFADAGLPDGCFTNLYVDDDTVHELLAHPRVAAVTVTGSVEAGAAVARSAGANIKRCVLELGGSDPFIVLPGADIDLAVATGIQSRFLNSGQSCIAAKRFIVHESLFEDFVDAFSQHVRRLVVGNPLLETTDIGPLARADLRERLADQIERSVAMGARCTVGGDKLPGPGFFYEPTVLTQIDEDMPIWCEETFGPAAPSMSCDNTEHAVQLANATEFGLAATVFADHNTALDVASQLECGHVAINAMVKSDPRLPFGGVKNSGIGRELGRYGLLEFVNIKTFFEPSADSL